LQSLENAGEDAGISQEEKVVSVPKNSKDGKQPTFWITVAADSADSEAYVAYITGELRL
jgi:hypothetical protein